MKNICVAIETTNDHLGLSIHSFDRETGNQKCLATFLKSTRARQSDLLIPTLDGLLKKTRIAKTDIKLVAVDVGPGSFTGVRVGVSVARTLGQVLGIPVVGISSLEILAADASLSSPRLCKKTSPKEKDEYIVSSIPALQGELYFAVFKAKGNKFHGAPEMKIAVPPTWASQEEFLKVSSRFKNAWVGKLKPISPKLLAAIAIQKFVAEKNKKKFGFLDAVPLYLQPSWAERKNGK